MTARRTARTPAPLKLEVLWILSGKFNNSTLQPSKPWLNSSYRVAWRNDTFLSVMGKSVYCLLRFLSIFFFSLGCSANSDPSFAPSTLVHFRPLLESCSSLENQSLSLGKTEHQRAPDLHNITRSKMNVGFVFIWAGSSRAEDVKSSSYSVIMVGNSNVGKTSFIKRVLNGRFSSDLPSSVGETLFLVSNLADKSCWCTGECSIWHFFRAGHVHVAGDCGWETGYAAVVGHSRSRKASFPSEIQLRKRSDWTRIME